MSVFKEIKKNDGSGISSFYRIYNGNIVEMTCDYNSSKDKPQINGVTLEGNKTASELGLPDIEVLELSGKNYFSIFKTDEWSEKLYLLAGDGYLTANLMIDGSSSNEQYYKGTLVWAGYDPETSYWIFSVFSMGSDPVTWWHEGTIGRNTRFNNVTKYISNVQLVTEESSRGGVDSIFKKRVNVITEPISFMAYIDGATEATEFTLPINTLGIGRGQKIILTADPEMFFILPNGDMYCITDMSVTEVWMYKINKTEDYLKACAGFDNTKTQVLKNINGVLTWIDE